MNAQEWAGMAHWLRCAAVVSGKVELSAGTAIALADLIDRHFGQNLHQEDQAA